MIPMTTNSALIMGKVATGVIVYFMDELDLENKQVSAEFG